MSLVKFQYDESSAHGVQQQQHDHFCMTMHAASFVQRDGYLSHPSLCSPFSAMSLSWLELFLDFATLSLYDMFEKIEIEEKLLLILADVKLREIYKIYLHVAEWGDYSCQ